MTQVERDNLKKGSWVVALPGGNYVPGIVIAIDLQNNDINVLHLGGLVTEWSFSEFDLNSYRDIALYTPTQEDKVQMVTLLSDIQNTIFEV